MHGIKTGFNGAFVIGINSFNASSLYVSGVDCSLSQVYTGGGGIRTV